MSRVISGRPDSRVRIVNDEFAHSQITYFPTIESVVKESATKRHRRFGPLGNSTVLVLPTDISWMSKRVPIQQNSEQAAVNFLIATDIRTLMKAERSFG